MRGVAATTYSTAINQRYNRLILSVFPREQSGTGYNIWCADDLDTTQKTRAGVAHGAHVRVLRATRACVASAYAVFQSTLPRGERRAYAVKSMHHVIKGYYTVR